jgi:hypothetical protein
MDLKILLDTPPWDWPRDAGNIFEEILTDNRANESERLVAAELAGDFTVINDELADALMTIIRSADEPEQLRAETVYFSPSTSCFASLKLHLYNLRAV